MPITFLFFISDFNSCSVCSIVPICNVTAIIPIKSYSDAEADKAKILSENKGRSGLYT